MPIRIRPWLVPLLCVALGACQAYVDKYVEPPVVANIMPTNYQQRIIDTLRLELPDVTGIRDAYIADPVLKQAGPDQRYIVCMKFNARDGNGTYIGSREKAGYYFSGQLTQIVDAPPGLCTGAAYRPFPELQRLCPELRCPK